MKISFFIFPANHVNSICNYCVAANIVNKLSLKKERFKHCIKKNTRNYNRVHVYTKYIFLLLVHVRIAFIVEIINQICI